MLPSLALSVRQPWAWAIFNGKDVENRSRAAIKWMAPLNGRRAIHAAKGMTREEYELARDFMAERGVACPAPAELLRGGILGTVDVDGVVTECESRWFCGPCGLVLRNPEPHPFIRATGALGYFAWKPAEGSNVPEPPAKWMLHSRRLETATSVFTAPRDEGQLDLIDLCVSEETGP